MIQNELDRTTNDLLDPVIMSPKYNFGSACDERRLPINITSKLTHKSECVESLYTRAHDLAIANEISSVVIIGENNDCDKLCSVFSDSSAFLFHAGLDSQDTASSNDLRLHRISVNFDDPFDINVLFKNLDNIKSVLFIVTNIMERLDDPRHLFRFLRNKLKEHKDNRLIISFHDRDSSDGIASSWVPDNNSYVRQWNKQEVSTIIASSGFRIDSIYYLEDNTNKFIVAELSCDNDYYDRFLDIIGFPKPSPHLVITTEHAAALRTGGIGTYYHIAEGLSGVSRIILYCGAHGLPDDWSSFIKRKGFLHSSSLSGNSSRQLDEIAQIDYGEILDALMLVVFIYDDLLLIEYQDYLGIGVHVAQAKKARMLPPDLSVVAYCHGNHFYLDNAFGEIANNRDPMIDVRERLSVELADVVLFPSQFIKELYTDKAGFCIDNWIYQPYPYDISSASSVNKDISKINTIVFYGKQTKQKGYCDICEALLNLFGDQKYSYIKTQIKHIYLLGCEQPDNRILALPDVTVSYGSYSLSDVVGLLTDLAKSSLVILPYKGDNHPFSVLEVVNSNSQFIAYDAGGIPEQIPFNVHDKVLCKPDHVALSESISQALNMTFKERVDTISQIKLGVAELYMDHTTSYINTMNNIMSGHYKNNSQTSTEAGSVSVVVPNYNGLADYIYDAIDGISGSILKPEQVVFVDDCSDEEHFNILVDTISKSNHKNHIIIKNKENKGLSGARNAGLSTIATKYVCVHDNDNIILNQFLYKAVKILDGNPDVTAVTSWLSIFNDGDDWRVKKYGEKGNYYRPIGQDIGLGLSQNCFGDALAVYRTDDLRKIGGWDDTNKSLWEDWQLFLRLTANGKKIYVIPKEMFLYRHRKTSMVRTYPNFGGWIRISNAITCIPKNQRFGLVRAINHNECRSLEHELSLFKNALENIQMSRSWKVTAPLRSFLNKLRIMRRIARATIAKVKINKYG